MEIQVSTFPWTQLIGVLTFAAIIIMVLVRYGLRKPAELATMDDIKEFKTALDGFQKSQDRMEGSLKDFEQSCITRGELNGYGGRLEVVERSYLSTSDTAIKALNRSTRALREMQGIREELTKVVAKIDPMPERLGRMEEILKRLERRYAGDEA